MSADPVVTLWEEYKSLHRQADALSDREGADDSPAALQELDQLLDRADDIGEAIRKAIPETPTGILAKFAWSVGAVREEFTNPEWLSANASDVLLTLRDARRLAA